MYVYGARLRCKSLTWTYAQPSLGKTSFSIHITKTSNDLGVRRVNFSFILPQLNATAAKLLNHIPVPYATPEIKCRTENHQIRFFPARSV